MYFGVGNLGRVGGKRNTTFAASNPSLSLDFMTPGVLDPRITFTRASTGTYFDSAGVMQMAAVNEPRWDYDPATSALRGLLIEEARTNLWLQSDNAANAAWAKEAVTVAAPVVTANQTTAPSGTLTAARVVYPTVTGASPTRSVLSQAIAVTSGTPITFSVYLKGNVGGEQLYVCTLGALAGRTLATLTTQWQRITLTIPTPGTGSGFFEIGCDLRDANQSAGIAAQTVFVWGAQLELGAFPTSYIPTTSSAVTRAADACRIPVGPWYNSTTGSMSFEYSIKGTSTDTPYGSPMQLVGADYNTDSISASGLQVRSGTAYPIAHAGIRIGGAPGAGMEYSPFVFAEPGTTQRGASSWAASVPFRAAHNGTSANVATGTPGALPVMLNLTVGGPIGYQTQISLWARNARYWNRQLSQTELQSVTTL